MGCKSSKNFSKDEKYLGVPEGSTKEMRLSFDSGLTEKELNKPRMKKVGSFRVTGNNAKSARHFTKFVLNFGHIEECYKAINIGFCKKLVKDEQQDEDQIKEKMRAKSTRGEIPNILSSLNFPDTVIPVRADSEEENAKLINFKDFLILTAGIYYKAKDTIDLEDPTLKTISLGLNLVQEMFDVIDEDGSGFIEKDEFKQTLMPLTNNPILIDIRMEELDYNHDNQVSRDEFLFGIAQWVGFNEDDLDD